MIDNRSHPPQCDYQKTETFLSADIPVTLKSLHLTPSTGLVQIFTVAVNVCLIYVFMEKKKTINKMGINKPKTHLGFVHFLL